MERNLKKSAKESNYLHTGYVVYWYAMASVKIRAGSNARLTGSWQRSQLAVSIYVAATLQFHEYRETFMHFAAAYMLERPANGYR